MPAFPAGRAFASCFVPCFYVPCSPGVSERLERFLGGFFVTSLFLFGAARTGRAHVDVTWLYFAARG